MVQNLFFVDMKWPSYSLIEDSSKVLVMTSWMISARDVTQRDMFLAGHHVLGLDGIVQQVVDDNRQVVWPDKEQRILDVMAEANPTRGNRNTLGIDEVIWYRYQSIRRWAVRRRFHCRDVFQADHPHFFMCFDGH